ncbi:MAG: hypothetical protein JXR10_17695 [Cyclobacteriaceae bacterium]
MKKRRIIFAAVWVAIASLIWSCEEPQDGVTPKTDDIENNSKINSRILGSNSAISRVRDAGFASPIGAIFGNVSGSANGRTNASTPMQLMSSLKQGNGQKANSSARVANDSTDNEPNYCFIETWEEDGAGNYRFTLDFGDGCEFDGELFKGKLIETGSYTDNSFSATTLFDNFGGEDWSINGTESFNGTWEGFDFDDEDFDEDYDDEDFEDEDWDYSMEYEFTLDLNEIYVDFQYTEDDNEVKITVETEYKADGKEREDENGFIIESNNESVVLNTGEEFHSTVDAPLVYSYACEDEADVWIPVEGIESGSYTFEGESGTYSIDYGDGTCDNIVTYTENGEFEVVDLGDFWEDEDWDEEDYDEEEDEDDDNG